jgi:hypothetical protein
MTAAMRDRRRRLAVIAGMLVIILSAGLAGADDAGEAAGEAPPVAQITAADVADAPRPSQATGVKVGDDRARHAWRWVPRVLLFVPRWTFWALVQPIRGSLWAYERYGLKDRIKGIFFNDDETIGAYPLAFFETGFGLNVGGRLILRDLIAADSEMKFRASYGGRFRQIYAVSGETGDLLPFHLEAEAAYEIYPRSRFFGIGNADLVDGATVAMPVDPRARDTAVKTRYHHDDLTAEVAGRVHLAGDLDLRLSGRYLHSSFEDEAELGDGDFDIYQIYDRSRLVGYQQDLSSLTGELELIYDSRRGTEFWVTDVMPNTGWKLAGFAGYTGGLGDDPSDFIRYGLDLQRVLDIHDGVRTVMLRLYGEGVTGKTADVPFSELPKIGGPIFLRGYQRDRFRDRVSAIGTIEYRWMVNKFLAAFLFVDAGRVYKSWSDFEFDGMRVGYGGGLQAHTVTTFRGRFDVSSSIDGAVFLNLTFDPVYDTSSRKESL